MKLSIGVFHLPLTPFLSLRKEQRADFLCDRCEGIHGHGSGPLLLCPCQVYHLLADEQGLQPRSAPSQLCSGLFLETGRIASLVSSNPDYFIIA